MEQERLYRLSIPGIVFLAVMLLSYLLCDGPIDYVSDLFSDAKITFFISVIITAPVLGLIISTLSLSIIHKFVGHKFYLKAPSDELMNKILTKSKDLPLKSKLEKKKIDSMDLSKFYYKFQAYFRIHAEEETIKFLQRRWNFLWIQVNNISAIVFGFIFGVISSFLIEKIGTKLEVNKNILFLFTAGLLFYCWAALHHIKFLKNEIFEIEEESLLIAAKKDNNQENKK